MRAALIRTAFSTAEAALPEEYSGHHRPTRWAQGGSTTLQGRSSVRYSKTIARILLIEDDLANGFLAVYLLQHAGHTVVTAATGQVELTRAVPEWPDLIVCDLRLPDRDGIEVIRLLKGDPRLHAIPVVVVTMLSEVGTRHAAQEAGAEGYLTKPIEVEQFVRQSEGYMPLAA